MEPTLPQHNLHCQTTADGFDTVYSPVYRQTFHSKHGALTEAEHVFLKGSGVAQRLAAGQPTRLLEVGFGTGLNFFLTAHRSRLHSTTLHYVALEKALLPGSVLANLNHGQQLEAIKEMRRAFIEWRDTLPHTPPNQTLQWQWPPSTRLVLVLGDASQATIPAGSYHAIYHDAFSPEANPELWTEPFFTRLHKLLVPGGILATYSVKGVIRRNLQAVGFKVQKLPGPPGKREMLVARR